MSQLTPMCSEMMRRQSSGWGPVRLAWNHGFPGPELRRVERIATENENRLTEIWNEYFDIGQ
jgi:hypothetical protein